MTATPQPLSTVNKFLLLQLGISWGVGGLLVVTGFEPLMIVLLLALLLLPGAFAAREGGKEAVVELYKRCFSARHPAQYWVVVFLPAATFVVSQFLFHLLVSDGAWRFAPAVEPFHIAVFVSCLLEEIAWRGYATPRLLKHHSPAMTSLILGTFWSLWHVPNMFMDAFTLETLLGFLCKIPFFIAFTFLATWLGIRSRHSILLPTLLHFFVNWISWWFQPDWTEYVGTLGSSVLMLPVLVLLYRGLDGAGKSERLSRA